VFFAIAFGAPWTAWILLALIHKPSRWSVLLLLGGHFCSVAGITAAYWGFGWEGVKDVLSRLLLFRVPIFWWCFAFFPVFVAILAAAINSAIRGDSITFRPSEIIHQWWIVYNFLVAFLLGPLGEEAGWRGFLLPRLLERYLPLTASLMLGLIWSVWHVPLDYASYFHTILGGAEFTVHTVCLSVLMTVLFLNTRGSILLAMIVHWSGNISYELVSVVFPASRMGMPDHTYDILLVVFTLLIALLFRTQLATKCTLIRLQQSGCREESVNFNAAK